MTIILLKLQIAMLMLSLAFSSGGISKEQAISQAQQTIQEALSYVSSITPTSTPVIAQPIQPEPVSTGIPVIQDVVSQPTSIIIPEPVKSCSLSAYITKEGEEYSRTHGQYGATVEWTSENLETPSGNLYQAKDDDKSYKDTYIISSGKGKFINMSISRWYKISFSDGTTCETNLEKDIRP